LFNLVFLFFLPLLIPINHLTLLIWIEVKFSISHFAGINLSLYFMSYIFQFFLNCLLQFYRVFIPFSMV
jgi:hypothetical protein